MIHNVNVTPSETLPTLPPTTVLRDVFPLSQDYIIIKKLASVFSHCYGCAVVPPIPFMDITLSTQLGKTVERFSSFTLWG